MSVNSIDTHLAQIHQEGRIGLMTHAVVGYPSLQATVELVQAMSEAGADLVELQVPVADPIADGPTIQQACHVSLANRTKVADLFAVTDQLADKVDAALLCVSYANPVHKYGIPKFCQDARSAGLSGLLIPDAPREVAERIDLLQACQANNLHNIVTLSPRSTTEQIQVNAEIASGFAYCMLHAGSTGVRQDLASGTKEYLGRVRQIIDVPLAAGFGISKPEHVAALRIHADVAVIGSAILNIVNEGGDMTGRVQGFVREMRAASYYSE